MSARARGASVVGLAALVSVAVAVVTVATSAIAAAPTTPAVQPLAAATTTASVTPSSSAPPTITVAAVGDMCFASSVRRLVNSKGPKAPFSSTGKLLRAVDVTVGNLECALSKRGHPVSGKTYTFEGPPSAVRGLAWAGFDFVALANNHARDYGSKALLDTVKNLDARSIAHAGAGHDKKAAWRPAIIVRNGARIAFLSFSQIGPSSFRATSSSSGTAYTMSSTAVVRAIKRAHAKADYVIVSYHWGVERDFGPTGTQVRFGRASVRAGADLVLSHHPHVIQGVEFYRKGLIAYSLGNFVFSPGSENGHDTMVLSLTIGPRGIRNVVARAAHIDPYGRPVLAKGSTRTRILKIIRRTSRGRGTHVTISGGVARLRK